MKPSRDIASLLDIMAALRTPVTGCPWDLEQSFATIAPYTIEEAYEVADAIERGDIADLRDELGDLLLQVVFHARMAEEAGHFDFGGVVEAITTKLIRRHPHVFANARDLSPDEVKALWGEIKAQEKRDRAGGAAQGRRAGRAARRRFGWRAARPARFDARGEAAGKSRQGRLRLERRRARCSPNCARRRRRSRKRWRPATPKASRAKSATSCSSSPISRAISSVDPETALRGANAKFERRFAHIEARLGDAGPRA